MNHGPSRRSILIGGGIGAVALLGGGAGALSASSAGVLPRLFGADEGPDGVIPDVPPGTTRLVRLDSAARGQPVGFWTAVPEGSGDGAGLPVCLVLHGASATTADYDAFGFARFLTAAVRAGVPPFVLAGADGGRSLWEGGGPGSADDPQAMLAREMPAWCAERGFDSTRLAAYGWSMGGYGTLRAAQLRPGTLRAVAALSRALSGDDAVLRGATRLEGPRTALWCGRSDGFLQETRDLADAIPGGPAIAEFDLGAHTRRYWNRITPAAFAFVGGLLSSA